MNLRLARIVAVVAVVVAALALAPLAAGGSPIDDKRAQASRLQAQIAANGAKLNALSEQYNGAVYRLQKVDGQIAEAELRVKAAQDSYDKLRSELSVRAAQIYMGAGNEDPLAAIDVQSINDLGARSHYAAAASSRDRSLMARLVTSKEALQTQRKQLGKDRAQAQSERDRIAKTRDQLKGVTAQQENLLSKTQSDLAGLIKRAQAEARAAQAALAAARQRSVSTSSSGGGGGGRSSRPGVSIPVGSIPPTSPRAMTAVNFALAQVGKPYKYATSGPSTYDCSGLTAAAWGAAGVSLPHYSGAQYDMLPHVPLSALQPGDLVFRGPGGSQHVSLYIGNGRVVTAPQTGDFVKVAGMGRVLPMGARPG
jgi:cell wall-associated NlpC family hydrolase